MILSALCIDSKARESYDWATVVNARQRPVLRSFASAFVIIVMASLLAGFSCNAQAEGEVATRNWTPILIGVVILILATAVAGWYFGRPVRKVPFLIGIAAFSAACGIGLGLSPEAAFAALVPALAAAFGGALVCAVSAKAPTSEVMSYGSAASGIPLLLGAFLGSSFIDKYVWYADTGRLVSALLIFSLSIAVAVLVGRKTKNIPLNLGAAAFGAVVGMATGLSRYPVVAYVAPATLALFMGAASYAFTANKEQRHNIGGVLTCFAILLVTGLFLGAIVRLELGWSQAPRLIFAFGALVLTTLALGSAVGGVTGNLLSGLGFATLGSGVGVAIGLSQTVVTHVVVPVLLSVFSGLIIYVVAADREDRAVSIRLLGVFAVLVLLGSFAGYTLRQEELCKQVVLLRNEIEALKERCPEPLPPEVQAVVDEADETVAEAEQQATLSVWLEGSATASAIRIDVHEALGGVLRVVERVDGRVLYEAAPPPNTSLPLSGESLEISWPITSGRDSISFVVWDRMIEQDGVWTVAGQGESIDTSLAEVRNGRFVIIYP